MKRSIERNWYIQIIVYTWHCFGEIATNRDSCHISRNVKYDEKDNSHSVISRAFLKLKAVLRSQFARTVATISHEFSMEHYTIRHVSVLTCKSDTCSACIDMKFIKFVKFDRERYQ